jgi:hypothetical protein
LIGILGTTHSLFFTILTRNNKKNKSLTRIRTISMTFAVKYCLNPFTTTTTTNESGINTLKYFTSKLN